MKEIILYTLIFLGAAFMLIAAIGLNRFSDVYSRMHATTKATSFGALLLIIGACLFFSTGIVWVKGLMVVFFIYLTAPLAAHSIAKSKKKRGR